MNILIVSRSNDNHSVDLVTESLDKRGASVYRLDTDYYPSALRFSSLYDGSQSVSFGSESEQVVISSLDAVWYRRFGAGACLRMDELGDTYEACMKESRMNFWGHLRALDCFQLDPQDSIRKADYKEVQIHQAQKLGIKCPKTLHTNDPNAVLQFMDNVEGRVVTKMQSQFAIYRGDEENVVFTNEVDEKSLAELDGLAFCPMIFQEMIPKELEIRVTVVGHQVFAAAVDSQRSERAKVDWRRDGDELTSHWVKFDFPEDEAKKLLELISWFGLNYAAADYLLTPSGELVFLEINACGEWLWLQMYADLSVADAIAEVLTVPGARRVNP